MSQFFKISLYHSPKEDGKYKQIETVYHLHDDTDGYDNHRCSLTEDGKYFCPGCKQSFEKEEVDRYPHRDLPKNKSYWIESRRSGQHLPHNEKDIFWSHVHPQDDLLKRKAAEVDFSGIFATCLVCEKILNLHTWKERNPKNKQLVFPGIVIENISVPIWEELKIFLEENIEIWLQDKEGKFFFLSNQLQLLPAENQEGILVCGDHLFFDNDDRKCLLFQIEEISQTLIDKHLKEALTSTKDLHLEIKMATEAEIPKRPESRRRSTKELSSGELSGLQTPSEREQSQEIIVIVNGEQTETHKIPKHYEVNLNEATPLPKDAHPLLVTEKVITDNQDSWPPKMVITIERAETSGILVLPDIAGESTMILADAPTDAVPKVTEDAPAEPAMTEQPVTNVNPAETPDPLENANPDINENAITADSGMLGNQLPDFTSVEDDWFSTGEKEVDRKKLLKEHARTQAWLDKLGKATTSVPKSKTIIRVPSTAVPSKPPMALAKTPTAAVSTVTDVTDSHDGFAPTELAMTDETGTDVAEDEPTPVSHHGASRLCWECQRRLPANQACSEHEVSCPNCGMANSKKESTCRFCQHVFCPHEPAMTESANTGTTDAPSPEPIPASESTRQCIICGKLLRSNPLTGEEVCDEHEKSCFICATVNPKEAIFCGGCGSPFKIRKVQITTQKSLLKEAITKIGLVVGMISILVFGPMFFGWLINYFQREDLKAELQAAEKRLMELSKQNTKLRMEADQIRFDLLESKRDLGQIRNDISTVQTEQQRLAKRQSELDNRISNAISWEADLHAYFVKEKNMFGQYLAELSKNLRDEQKAWQRQEHEQSEQRYAELVKQFKSLTTQPRETPIVAPPNPLFGGKPEQEKPETAVAVVPAKSFLDELMPALIELNKQLAKKYRNHKKAPPTLVVEKMPVTPPPQNSTKKTPPAVDKSKNPQKSAEKTPKKPPKTGTPPTFEAKDLVHVWTGPTYF